MSQDLLRIRNSDFMWANVRALAREQNSESTWYLDVYGPVTGVAAIAASFHRGSTLRPNGYTVLGWLGVRKPAGVKFKTMKFTLVPGYQRVVLFPDLATTDKFPLVSAFVVGERAAAPLVDGQQPVMQQRNALFARVLQVHTIWPMLDRWADGIWTSALSARNAVKKLDGYGLKYAWLVDLSADWQTIIQKALDNDLIE